MSIKDDEVKILNPLGRVPVSMIIDDSTSLVNLAYYGIPQFAEVFPKKLSPALAEITKGNPGFFRDGIY